MDYPQHSPSAMHNILITTKNFMHRTTSLEKQEGNLNPSHASTNHQSIIKKQIINNTVFLQTGLEPGIFWTEYRRSSAV